MQVELRRQACTWTVPFTVIQLPDGSWIMNQIDLTSAGNPARPCNPSTRGHHHQRPDRGNLSPARVVILLRELEQNAGRRLRVHEGDPAAAGPRPRHLIHETIASRAAGGERGVEVAHPVADVVDAGATALEKPGDGTVGVSGASSSTSDSPKGSDAIVAPSASSRGCGARPRTSR